MPWRPADLEQREGRIIRRHNQNSTVRIFVYIAEKTFDTYMWQVLERKAFFIEQGRLADRNARDIEDLDSDSLAENAAMIKAIATGDDRYVRQIELENIVAELQAEQDAYFSAARSAERERASLQAAIPGHHTSIAAMETGLAAAEQRQNDGAVPPLSILDTVYSERADAARALVEALRETAGVLRNRPVTEARTVAVIGGFEVETRYSTSSGELYIGLTGLAVPPKAIELEKLYLDPKKANTMKPDERDKALAHLASGVMTRIENLVNELPAALDDRRWKLRLDTDRLHQLDTEQPTEFERLGELKAAYDELDTLQRRLREEATSPEALALREALHQRLAVNGRTNGWSLKLNPTPALCRQLGYDSPAQVRAVMAERQDEALLNAIEQHLAERGNDAPSPPELTEDCANRGDAAIPSDGKDSSQTEGATVMALVAKSIANKAIEPIGQSSESAPVIPLRERRHALDLSAD